MNRSAIIIFYKTPIQGRVKTRLQPQLEEEISAELAHFLICETLIATRATVESLLSQGVETDIFLFGDHSSNTGFHHTLSNYLAPYNFYYRQQVSGSLGERMLHAFDFIFKQGYKAAAIFGTDSPDLPIAYRMEALRTLLETNAEISLGATEDGGYYTLAMKKFFPKLFEGITYSASTTHFETLQKAQSLTPKVASLPIWYDVDEFSDLVRLHHSVLMPSRPVEELALLREFFSRMGHLFED